MICCVLWVQVSFRKTTFPRKDTTNPNATTKQEYSLLKEALFFALDTLVLLHQNGQENQFSLASFLSLFVDLFIFHLPAKSTNRSFY